MANLANLKRALIGYIKSLNSTDMDDAAGTVSQLVQVPYVARITDGGTAGTAAAEASIGYVPWSAKVVSINLEVPVGVTADANNKATFTVGKRTAGGARTTIGTLTTDVAQGNLTAFAPAALTLTTSAVNLAAGDTLTLQLAKAGTGVAIAAATAEARVTVIVEKGQ